MKLTYLSLFLLLFCPIALKAQNNLYSQVDQLADKVEPKVIEWRRHFHQNPELSNREFKTAEKIAEHLKQLGLEVRTKIAHTGVVGILRTGKPGPVIALRADMDALPVIERTPIAFASTVKSTYNGQEVGVMHACGHDAHVAMLMGTAEVLVQMKNELKGTIVFIFQPAEESAPDGEEGGAELMVKEGVLDDPKVEVVFGLHINSQTEVGTIRYKTEGIMAAVDKFKITIKGKSTHGSTPWTGNDPIVIASEIVNSLQTIVSRHIDITQDPAVVTVGWIKGGVRNNIIPETVEMEGTIRTFNETAQNEIHRRIQLIAQNIAESADAVAEVKITKQYPVTYNNIELTNKMLPTLQRVAGKDFVKLTRASTGAEDFSFYAKKVPGLFFFLGGMTKGADPTKVAPHHTPDFFIDESGLKLGVRTFANLVLDYLAQKK